MCAYVCACLCVHPQAMTNHSKPIKQVLLPFSYFMWHLPSIQLMGVALVMKGIMCYYNAKQKHLGCKKVRGQSEATLQTGRRDQNI